MSVLAIFCITSNTPAADQALDAKKMSAPFSKELGQKGPAVDVKATKIQMYDLGITGTIKTTEQGKWEYSVSIWNKHKSEGIPMNTIEIVVVRKHPGGETLLGTYPVTTELKKYGVEGSNFVIKNELPFCCSTPEHEARIRLRGTSRILGQTIMHTGSCRTLRLSDIKIVNNGTGYTVNMENYGNRYIPAIIKASISRNGKLTEVGQQELVIPPGNSAYMGHTSKIDTNQPVFLKVYARTTCSTDTPEQCLISQGSGK
jgi:hypothetical protein